MNEKEPKEEEEVNYESKMYSKRCKSDPNCRQNL